MLNIENQTVNFRHFVLLSTKINVVYYTNKSFENGSAARKVLEYHLADQAAEDRAAVVAALEQGSSLEEAAAPYVTEEAFDEWYLSFCGALKDAVNK